VGKTSAARVLAKSLNCPDGPSANGCEDFPGSEEIARGTSLDVIEIDGASNTSVNDVREIKDEVLFAPNSSRYKIYIIDEVHMLSNSAFNALLKTIEEPPPYIVFIFATTEIQKVPATIRSRCQQFTFRLIPLDTINSMLRDAVTELGIEAEDEALLWIAKEATGSLRDAYTLLDQVTAFSGDRITLEKIQKTLGVLGTERLAELVTAMAQRDAQSVLRQLDEILAAGVSVEQFVVDLTEYFRDLLFAGQGITKATLLRVRPELLSPAARKVWSAEQIEKALELLFELYRDIRYSLNPRFELELALSRLTRLAYYVSVEEIRQGLDELRSAIAGSDTAPKSEAGEEPAGESDPAKDGEEAAAPAPAPAPAPEEVAVTEPRLSADSAFAGEVVPLVKKKRLTLGSVLEKALSWKLAEGELWLEFDSVYNGNVVRQEAGLIEEVIQETLGAPVKLKVSVRPAPDANDEATNEQVELVKKVFRGEVVT
jgi:DNA polymerase-3 subunit gamma/tau